MSYFCMKESLILEDSITDFCKNIYQKKLIERSIVKAGVFESGKFSKNSLCVAVRCGGQTVIL